ncbi:PfkB family carbohydrate kinase [Streptomyces sp. NPDC016309]|uniref:PfkB family carbohydrate kinase n=1 Tax=Streptomyces sp. NPDC016309 TaxID=3364965 RepID=UPI0036F7CE48
MIVAAGESLIDLVPTGAEPLSALVPRRGGGPYNTAVALGRLGAEAAFCSRVSTDAFGEALLAGLRAAGVATGLVQRGAEPTTLAVASVGADGSAGYSFHAEGTADRLFELPGRLPDAVRAMAFGTCSLALEPGASAYEALLRREAGRGVLTLLDPNVRPGLLPDAEAHRARFTGWLPYVSLLKLSEEDARWLGGSPGEWLAAGPEAVVLTRGAEGLTVFTEELTVSVPAVPVAVADTIGAGDTVNAALLHGLGSRPLSALDAGAWTDLLSFAARAAAVTCSRPGAEPPYAAELVTSDTVLPLHGVPALVCSPGGPALAGRQAALDLVGDALGREAALVVVPVERLGADFFSLRTGVAGEVVQKFTDYGLRLVVVGDVSHHVAGSTPLRDFVREANRGSHVWFTDSIPALAARLAPSP